MTPRSQQRWKRIAAVVAITLFTSYVHVTLFYLRTASKNTDYAHAEAALDVAAGKSSPQGLPAVVQKRKSLLEADGNHEQSSNLRPAFTWTIVTTAKPFAGSDAVNQRRAIMSWLRLDPKPRVLLLGNQEELKPICQELQVLSAPVDTNAEGMPLFNHMVYIAMNQDTDIAVLVNADIIFTSSMVAGLYRVQSRYSHFLVTGARYDVPDGQNVEKENPLHSSWWEYRKSAAEIERLDDRLQAYARQEGMLHTYGGSDFWAWSTGRGDYALRNKFLEHEDRKGEALYRIDWACNSSREGFRPEPLFQGLMPHFINGRGKYDNWLVHEAISAGKRTVIDASTAIITIHVLHKYSKSGNHMRLLQSQEQAFSTSSKWSFGKLKNWEQFLNIHLAQQHGTYSNQLGTLLHTRVKLAQCDEENLGNMCFTHRERPATCPCEYSSEVCRTQTDPKPMKVDHSMVLKVGDVSVDREEDFGVIPLDYNPDSPVRGLPWTLDDLLQLRASDNLIILIGGSAGYFTSTMHLVCNLRRLGIANFVVAAFDEEMYLQGFRQGLPIYLEMEQVTENRTEAHQDSAKYGSKAFRKITKVKSRAVLRVLRKGYDVLWSDTDIAWFKDPIPHLQRFKANIVVQSNAPDGDSPNGARRINSGFYLVKSSPDSIAAMEDVVSHASKSPLSEQPSFYDVLCCADRRAPHERPGKCVQGDSMCVYTVRSGATVNVQFLDRNKFPNGVTRRFWEGSSLGADNGKLAHKYGLYIIHNNWIEGNDAKKARQQRHNLWYYDEELQVCSYHSDGVPDLLWTRASVAGGCSFPWTPVSSGGGVQQLSEVEIEGGLSKRATVELNKVSTWPSCKYKRSFGEIAELWRISFMGSGRMAKSSLSFPKSSDIIRAGAMVVDEGEGPSSGGFEGYPISLPTLKQALISTTRNVVVYSFGVGINPNFEHDLLLLYASVGTEPDRLRIYSFDPMVSVESFEEGWQANIGKRKPSAQHFFKVGLAPADGKYLMNRPNSFHSDAITALSHLSEAFTEAYHMDAQGSVLVSLETIMCVLNHSLVDVMKIDIEGLEYLFLEQVKPWTLRSTQLVVTFHPRMISSRDPAERFERILGRLKSAGYMMVATVDHEGDNSFSVLFLWDK